MFEEFAYSRGMQLILGVVAFSVTFFSIYYMSKVILAFCGMTASRRARVLFAFITGTLMQSVWVYMVYFIGGMVSFDPLKYSLMVSPNPFFALLYYYIAMKVLKLSPIRSIKMMGYVYFYWILYTSAMHLFAAAVFVQPDPMGAYNYLMDVCLQLTVFTIFMLSTRFILRYIRNHPANIRFLDNGFVNRRKELLAYFVKISFYYLTTVIVPRVVANDLASAVIVEVVLFLFLFLSLYMDLHAYDKQLINNQEVHISTLFKGLEEFRGIKHDFQNILHTYSGYLELGEYSKLSAYHATLVQATTHASSLLDLAQRAPENPAFIALIIDKLAAAEIQGIKLMISLECSIDDFFIPTSDVCIVLDCLLNNAIAAAALSKEKRIHFSCESPDATSKLITLTGSNAGPVNVQELARNAAADVEKHDGMEFSTIRIMLQQYGNCAFRLKQYSDELSAYVELRRA